VIVQQVLFSQSPLFLAGADEEGRVLAFLAGKDEFGNPLSVTGIAWREGQEYLSVEFDPLGRPVRLVSPRRELRLFGYEADRVFVESIERGSAGQIEVVAFDATELEALRVKLPTLDPTLKDATLLPFANLDDFASSSSNFYGCAAGTPTVGRTPRLGSKTLAEYIAWIADCAGLYNKFPFGFQHIQNAIGATASTIGCVSDVATVGVGAASLAGAPAAVAAAVRLPIDCAAMVRDTEKLLYDLRTDQPFMLSVSGKLVQGESGSLSVSTPDSFLDSVLSLRFVADLSALGGNREELTRASPVWRWQGMVTPLMAGRQTVRLYVDGKLRSETLVDVEPDRAKLKIVLHSSHVTARAGDSITLRAEVREGMGMGPYVYRWGAQPGGLSVRTLVASPEQPDRVMLQLQERTRFSVAVVDGSPLKRQAEAPPLWVEICGDKFCAPSEDASTCADDCSDLRDGGQSDGGASDAALANGDGGIDPPRDAAIDPDASAESPQNDAPYATDGTRESYCTAACAYRAEIGCSGDPNTCFALCLAVHTVATQEGACSTQATSLEQCRYSRRALRLDCGAGGARVDREVCALQDVALDLCRAQRDAPSPQPRGDAGVIVGGSTPVERCNSACAYRSLMLGCGGPTSSCAAVCIAIQSAAAQSGRCVQAELALHDCRYSEGALNLGCTASDAQIDATVCTVETQALRTCQGT
jgi:hypothetical protein